MSNNQNSNNQYDSIYFRNYLTSNKKSKFDIKELVMFLGSVLFIGATTWTIIHLMNNNTHYDNPQEDYVVESASGLDNLATTEPVTNNSEAMPVSNDGTKHNKYLDECPIVDEDRYTGNEGDSFIYPIGKHEATRGNTCIDGASYEHGLEAWIARWNYTDETSWAMSTFDIDGEYKSLTGECKLIQSYNTTDFNTTLEFWGDDTLITSYILTPETIPFTINLDISNYKKLKVYVFDNESKSGGTSFGLIDMVLSTEEKISNSSSDSESKIIDCYTGTYTAGQGETLLDFVITECDSDYNTDALFLFYASQSNQSVPTGSYKMKGSLVEKYDDGTMKMYFEGSEWVQQPSTYSFVNFTAIINPSAGTISSQDYSVSLNRMDEKVNNTFNNHTYCLFNAPMNAEQAEITCKAMGGHLVSINSADEQAHFEDMIKLSNKNNIWTGGYYEDGAWKWTDSSEFTYSNWDDDKPDNYWGDEFFIKVATRDIKFDTWNMYKNKWDDVSKVADGDTGDVPISSFGFVCEWND